jgi:hypothetical protein
VVALIAGVVLSAGVLGAEQPATPPGPPKAAPVERLGPNLVRVGNVQADMSKREVTVNGTINEVTVLEFLANTPQGLKAYESAFTLDTNAINFNVALILIGLEAPSQSVNDVDYARPLRGDPVEITVDVKEGANVRRLRAEDIVFNKITRQTLPPGPWIYTGSAFNRDYNTYAAELDGILIGLWRVALPIIESPRPKPPGTYTDNILNPALKLKPGTPVTVVVRALPRK